MVYITRIIDLLRANYKEIKLANNFFNKKSCLSAES